MNPKLLDETWAALCSVLPTCLVEVQRAVAEVWGGVLRRLKSGPRDDAILLLATNVDLEDATAWAVIFSCKVSATLSFIVNQSILMFPVCFADLAYMHSTYIFDPSKLLFI